MRLINSKGNDAGLRFVDINEDGFDDVVFSNHERYGIWLFKDMQIGWSIEVLSGQRGKRKAEEELPPIVREDGTKNGFFVHSRHLFWQNEDTAHLADLVDRRSFEELLKNVKPAAKSPEMSLRSIHVKPGFSVELVAAEPLVMDPVAFEWGADGKLWVAEMADYPVGNDNGGRVRFLKDTDGDGKYDKSTLFLDGFNFPNGVMPWKKGVLITAAPEILYAEDTNSDGTADLKKVLFTGFGQGNQQHRVNGLAYGLDNWVYCANGDSNGRIKSSKTEKVIYISGRDFRINPETGELDPQSGRTQFGRNRDNWGNWFGSNNSNPHYHFVLTDHYLRRNPHITFPNPMNHVSVTPGAAVCYPISKSLARFNDYNKLNRFTSACSTIIFRDNLFRKEFAGNSFVSEPVHNLVHREVVSLKGVTFTSRRADDEQTSEFLASRTTGFGKRC
jgi:putative membrane-bound dehydrogenase-like protein